MQAETFQSNTEAVEQNTPPASRELSQQVVKHAQAIVMREVTVVPYDGTEATSLSVPIRQVSPERADLIA